MSEGRSPTAKTAVLWLMIGWIVVFMAHELWSFVHESDGIGFYRRQPYLILVCIAVGILIAACAQIVQRYGRS